MGQKLTCHENKTPTTSPRKEKPPVVDVEAPAPAPEPEPEPAPAPPRRDRHVSFDAVEEIVDDFMSDNAINNPLMPDFIERSIYRNVLKLMLGIMGRVLDTTELRFLGHNITMKLSPKEKEQKQELPV